MTRETQFRPLLVARDSDPRDRTMTSEAQAEALTRLCRAARGRDVIDDVLIVAAHPDDEAIGASSLLSALRARDGQPAIVHTTDGAPRDMDDALRAGFATREEYSAARRDELARALALAGIRAEQTRALAHVDKEASLALVELTNELVRFFREARPSIVVTHPYEGGHPDHDATAFAVRAAGCLLGRAGEPAPAVCEFTSYHAYDGGLRGAEFLSHADAPFATCDVELSADARRLKRRMFDCFRSQASVLGNFDAARERFRLAPSYDFTLPPHAGRLHYETYGWGWTGERWRALATAALRDLRLDEDLAAAR